MNKIARKKSMLCLLLAMLMVLPTGIAMASPENTTPTPEIIQNPPVGAPADPTHITDISFGVYAYKIGNRPQAINITCQTSNVYAESWKVYSQAPTGNWTEYNDELQANAEYLIKIQFSAKTGYDFDGLTQENIKLDGTPAMHYDVQSKTVTFALPVLKHKWTLTYETNGGSEIQPLEDQEDGLVVDLSNDNPTKPGHKFAGWYTEPELTNQVTSITLTANTTVYAKWTRIPTPSAPGGSYVPDLGRTPERMEIPAQNGREAGYVEAPAGSVDPTTRLRITEKANGKKDLTLVDENGNQVYSNELMLVTIPAPKGQQGSYRVKVNGVYTTFELSEDGKYVTIPMVFSRDGKMSEDVIVRQGGINVTGTYKALPGIYSLSVTDRGNARYSVNLTDASGNKVHSNGPVMVSVPAPQGVGEIYRLKVDGKWTTFEVKDGIVRFAMVF